MKISYQVINNNIVSHWSKFQDAIILYSDGLTTDRLCGRVIEINDHELIAEIFKGYDTILTPEDFVCTHWSISRIYHPNMKAYGPPVAFVLLTRKEATS